jgi:hypothetical protein
MEHEMSNEARAKAGDDYRNNPRFERRPYMERMNHEAHFLAGWDAAVKHGADDLDGATTTPPEAALATTAGEFAARWNSTDPASRDKRVSLINEGADIAARCFIENHIDHIHDLEAALAAAQAVIAETIAHHDFRSVPTRGDDYDIVCVCGYISLDGENDVCPTVRLLAQSPTDTLAADRARVRAELVAKINERLDRPMRPYGDPTFPLIPERVFLRDAYDDDLVNDLEAILAPGDAS